MSAHVLLNIDESDRLYGPTRRVFNTTDEAVEFAAYARSCNCQGEVVGVFDENGDEIQFGGTQSSTEAKASTESSAPAHSATKAEWEKYADAEGVSYPSDATKQQIIDAVEGK